MDNEEQTLVGVDREEPVAHHDTKPPAAVEQGSSVSMKADMPPRQCRQPASSAATTAGIAFRDDSPPTPLQDEFGNLGPEVFLDPENAEKLLTTRETPDAYQSFLLSISPINPKQSGEPFSKLVDSLIWYHRLGLLPRITLMVATAGLHHHHYEYNPEIRRLVAEPGDLQGGSTRLMRKKAAFKEGRAVDARWYEENRDAVNRLRAEFGANFRELNWGHVQSSKASAGALGFDESEVDPSQQVELYRRYRSFVGGIVTGATIDTKPSVLDAREPETVRAPRSFDSSTDTASHSENPDDMGSEGTVDRIAFDARTSFPELPEVQGKRVSQFRRTELPNAQRIMLNIALKRLGVFDGDTFQSPDNPAAERLIRDEIVDNLRGNDTIDLGQAESGPLREACWRLLALTPDNADALSREELEKAELTNLIAELDAARSDGRTWPPGRFSQEERDSIDEAEAVLRAVHDDESGEVRFDGDEYRPAFDKLVLALARSLTDRIVEIETDFFCSEQAGRMTMATTFAADASVIEAEDRHPPASTLWEIYRGSFMDALHRFMGLFVVRGDGSLPRAHAFLANALKHLRPKTLEELETGIHQQKRSKRGPAFDRIKGHLTTLGRMEEQRRLTANAKAQSARLQQQSDTLSVMARWATQGVIPPGTFAEATAALVCQHSREKDTFFPDDDGLSTDDGAVRSVTPPPRAGQVLSSAQTVATTPRTDRRRASGVV